MFVCLLEMIHGRKKGFVCIGGHHRSGGFTLQGNISMLSSEPDQKFYSPVPETLS